MARSKEENKAATEITRMHVEIYVEIYRAIHIGAQIEITRMMIIIIIAILIVIIIATIISSSRMLLLF